MHLGGTFTVLNTGQDSSRPDTAAAYYSGSDGLRGTLANSVIWNDETNRQLASYDDVKMWLGKKAGSQTTVHSLRQLASEVASMQE